MSKQYNGRAKGENRQRPQRFRLVNGGLVAVMSADKTIVRITDAEKQQAETSRYWRNLSVGERLSAVWDVSEAAYSFAATFKGKLSDDAPKSQRLITRVQQTRS